MGRTVSSVMYWLVCFPLQTRVAGSNPAEAMIFKGDKNPQRTFLWMEVKTEAPFRKILQHVKDSVTYRRY
jgi:hypothetical protein